MGQGLACFSVVFLISGFAPPVLDRHSRPSHEPRPSGAGDVRPRLVGHHLADLYPKVSRSRIDTKHGIFPVLETQTGYLWRF